MKIEKLEKTTNAQKKLGERIRELREQHDYSQEVFARICRLTGTQLSQIERGKADVSSELLSLIARKLETTAEEISGTLTPPPLKQLDLDTRGSKRRRDQRGR